MTGNQDHMAPFFNGKTVYVNYESCYKYEIINDKVTTTLCEDLSCPAHEEADSKIVFHVCKLDFDASVTIRCSDTDIPIIMLGNMGMTRDKLQIRMLLGTGEKRYLNINKLYDKLGDELCAALPAFHALTGCDFNPAFYKKGKKNLFRYCENIQNI